jgi:hypothetical protein
VEVVRIAKAEEREALLQLVTDKAEVAKNCEIWGPKCTLAKNAQATTETKLANARARLNAKGVVSDDPVTRRLVAALPFLTKEEVQLYRPLLVPLGLAIVGYLLISLALIKGREVSARALVPAKPEPKGDEPELQVQVLEASKPARATFTVVKKEPPAAMTRALTGLLEKAPRRRVAADEVYERYAARMQAEGQQPEALAEFLVHARTFCEHLGIETAVIDGKAYMRNVKLGA